MMDQLVRMGFVWGLLLGIVPQLIAQTPKATTKTATSEVKTLTTRDGELLRCTYFPSSAGKEAPVAIMLHGRNGNRQIWQVPIGNAPSFAQALQSNDFAVLTIDLRGHGENLTATAPAANKKAEAVKLTPRHYQAMVAEDLEAAKRFLLEEHEKGKLNISKLAIVAADFSAVLALAYTELDWSKKPYDDAPIPAQRTPRGQDVRALVLLSPDSTVPGINPKGGIELIRNLKGRITVFIAVGTKDHLDKGAAKRFAEQLTFKETGGTPYVFLQEYDARFRGTDLLGKQLGVESHMYKFLDDQVKKFEFPWRTRKSPLVSD
ncbi:MAG: hypothetical protein KatS3mg113_0976 [Planctomycetaceae bacterium]|nr:MAG: hypothetical protein KatS3mg113_0976 [Planctomycetaceae bacterium]